MVDAGAGLAERVFPGGVQIEGFPRFHDMAVDFTLVVDILSHAGGVQAGSRDTHELSIHDFHVDLRDLGDDVSVFDDVVLNVAQHR